jgi:hypothetical protein
MRVLHGMYYSLPAVVMISYLMWLTKSWASGIALTNLLTADFRAEKSQEAGRTSQKNK